MNERESFDTQQEAKRETLGKVSESTRERMFGGLDKYLAAEAEHARKAAKAEARKAGNRGT
ncbi:MAG: hypothetical protein LPK36_03180 [Actinomycetes bacterium]|nr:hypothetical protein [Actinomycetes bacterium]